MKSTERTATCILCALVGLGLLLLPAADASADCETLGRCWACGLEALGGFRGGLLAG
jgi:hypothetical protein